MNKKKNQDAVVAVDGRKLRHRIAKNWDLYLLLIVPFALVLLFKYYPMLGLQIAFKDYTVSGGIWGSKWVGFKYFEKLFTPPKFM